MNYLDVILEKLKSFIAGTEEKELIPGSSEETVKQAPVEEKPAKADALFKNTEELKNTEASGVQKTGTEAKAVDYESIFNKIIEDEGYYKYEPLGAADLICPSCKAELEEFPVKTIKCPSCKSYIYLRVRSSDSEKVILGKEQLDEFEIQEKISSGKYGKMIDMSIQTLNKYASSGIGGWRFISVLDEKDKPEFVKMHGNIIKTGSDEELEAIKLLCRPDCRAKVSPWFDNPKLDADTEEYEAQKNSWLEKYHSGNL